MDRQQLTPRLQAVYDLARRWRDSKNAGKRLIDVGSDHGYVSLEGLVTGDYDYVVATDIHENPADKTRNLLGAYGYADRSLVLCTDGLKGLELTEGDVVIMAGLGGNNMMDIIGNAMEVTSPDIMKTIIFCLQPQKTIEELRVFLGNRGFAIIDENVINDRGIYYPMLITMFDGSVHELTLREKYYGPVMIGRVDNGEKHAAEYFDKLNEVYNLRARGNEEINTLMQSLKETE